MKAMRCLLVDDERLARSSMRALLKAHPAVTVIGEASTLNTAEEAIHRLKPELVFLDVQLPDGDGFQLLERLDHAPMIIFVTAYDRYAVRAFEVNALDYLLKPIDPERLTQALGRVGTPPVPAGQLLLEDAVLIPAGRSGYFIRVEEILTITVDGNYTTVLTKEGRSHTVLGTLSDWEKRLPPPVFLRVDRTRLLNLREIHKIEPAGRHVLVEIGQGKFRIELGRAATERIRHSLGR